MKHRYLAFLLAAGLPLLGGCLERIDADLPVTGVAAGGQQVEWELAGTFGGEARFSQASADPWERRYEPGGFVQIAGLCATDKEVWVCDLGVSRVQVFDFEGTYLRSIGEGVPLEGTLATDEELYVEQDEFDSSTTVRWEDQEGQRWLGQERTLFKAADVLATDNGYWLADWVRTNATNKPKRANAVLFFGSSVAVDVLKGPALSWPSFIAADGPRVAVSQPPGNTLVLVDRTTGEWKAKQMGSGPSFLRIMEVKVRRRGDERYLDLLANASVASIKPGEFNRLGGVALAFDKLIACDPGNYRIQVFEARRDETELHWGKLIRIIPARTSRGGLRFEAPWDVDVDARGRVFVLDAARREVAVLNSGFERLGRFGHGDLLEPYALDLSDDGLHCFVSDQRNNTVLHYAARE